VEKAYSMLTTIEPNGRIIIPHQSSRLPHPRGEPVPGRGQPTHARPPADRTVVAASQSALNPPSITRESLGAGCPGWLHPTHPGIETWLCLTMGTSEASPQTDEGRSKGTPKLH